MSVGKRRRGKPLARSNRIVHFGRCAVPGCGKIRYQSRGDAKRAFKKLYPGDHQTAYECDGFWHFGHPPAKVVRGLGWGAETRLPGQAARIREEELQEPVECEGCGQLVPWLPDQGYAHECEVTGLDDERGQVR